MLHDVVDVADVVGEGCGAAADVTAVALLDCLVAVVCFDLVAVVVVVDDEDDGCIDDCGDGFVVVVDDLK